MKLLNSVSRKFFFFSVFLLVVCPASFSQPENAVRFLNLYYLEEPVINLIYQKIDYHWHKGEYEKIFPLFSLLVAIDPSDVEAWGTGGWFLINGLAHKLQGKQGDAIVQKGLGFWQQGLKINKNDYRLYWEIGSFYFQQKDYSKARLYLEQGKKLPHPYCIDMLLAHTYRKAGKTEEALAQWKFIHKEYPEYKEVAEKFIELLEKDTQDSYKLKPRD